ncbi:glycosyltransferase family 1 protein [Methanosarcinales archaeon]|nr:MAG: glycosyltransferase family 1 protein [Methanosarcinales archaeon]
MQIFIMDTMLPPEGNGWTTHKWEFVRSLSKSDYEVHVMTHRGTELGGVTTHPIKFKEEYKLGFNFKFMHLLNILKNVRQCHPDILYTRNVSFALLAFFTIQKPKLILELNGLYEEHRKFEKKIYGKKKVLKNLKLIMKDRLEIFVAGKANGVIAVTPKIKDLLIKRGIDENKITVVPNGANVELFRPMDDPLAINDLRYQCNIREDAPLVMFVGNLAYWQGVEYLIHSSPLVLKTISNTMFLIVGDGEVKDELMALAEKIGVSDKFIFVGNVPYKKVPLYINMADVCIVTKKILGFGYSPLKLYEYMACGKPIVATNTEGFEVLEQSNAGLLVNPENSQELANAIIKLLRNDQLREQMGANGRKAAVAGYSWDNSAKKTISVFKKVING